VLASSSATTTARATATASPLGSALVIGIDMECMTVTTVSPHSYRHCHGQLMLGGYGTHGTQPRRLQIRGHEGALYASSYRRIVSHRIASYRIVSHRIASYRIVSHRIASYRIVSHRIASFCIVSHRVVSYRIVTYCIVSHRVVSYRALSSRSAPAVSLVLFCSAETDTDPHPTGTRTLQFWWCAALGR
jgi:hypothetical protein